MWESRVLCEISKALWKPFCGFHSAGISIAVSAFVVRRGIGSGSTDEDAPGTTIGSPVGIWLPLDHGDRGPIIAGPLTHRVRVGV